MASNGTNQRHHVEIKKAFGGKIRSYRIDLCNVKQSKKKNKIKVRAILKETRSTIASFLKEALNEHRTVQATLKLEGLLDEYDYKTLSFKATRVLSPFDFKSSIDTTLETLISHIQWKFDKYESINDYPECSTHFHYLYLYIHEVNVQDIQLDDKMSLISSVVKQMNGIALPVQLDDIPLIEENNKFSINVYTKKIVKKKSERQNQIEEIEGPVYHTQTRKKLHINLLLSERNGTYHYSYHDFNIEYPLTPERRQFCDGCFGYFEERNFENHQTEECLKLKIKTPDKDTIEFSNDKYSEKLPFVVYAHFESLFDENDHQTKERRPNRVWIANIQKDLPLRYGYYIKCVDDDFCRVGTNCLPAVELDECIRSFTENLFNDLQEQWAEYKKKYPKDIIQNIPVILINLEKFGNYLIQYGNFDSYLSRLEKYFAIQKKLYSRDGKRYAFVKFLEFANFVREPLKEAAESLKEVGFKNMPLLFEERFNEQSKMLTDELIFPHHYAKSKDYLMETSLPTIATEREDNDKLNKHAQEVWKSFQCENIGDYLDVFIRSNIFQVANIIENLRDFCSKNYGLDPAHYLSIAAFSMDAMFKKTDAKLKLLSDIEMITFVKKGIRGGFVQCNKRYAVANNKYLPEWLQKEGEEESYIMYLDANNLGGFVMSQYLPYGELRWVDIDVDIAVYYNVPADSDVGYILEVDLSYPIELHDEHSDLPFCPKKKNVYGADNEFLVADFDQKTRYVIHHSYLALCVEKGLKIEKTHRVLQFQQKPWLEKYIKFNTNNRKEAKSKCDQNFFKLLNNTIYGKTMENPDNSGIINLFHQFDNVNNKPGANSAIARPDCSGYAICSESTVAVEFQKTNLLFKTPIYAGFCILDLAKSHMYKFHYNFMRKYQENLQLLYTDTDSLIYQFKNDCYEFVKTHVTNTDDTHQLGTGFDTSEYAENNIFDIPLSNHKEPGYFKDELNGAIMYEFVGLQPKVYAYNKLNEGNFETIIKAARVPAYVRDNFKVSDYKNCVDNRRSLYKKYSRIKAVDFDVYKQVVRRIVLFPNDPQREILSGEVYTVPWGYKGSRLKEKRRIKSRQNT